jgi:hypothetical protein
MAWAKEWEAADYLEAWLVASILSESTHLSALDWLYGSNDDLKAENLM